MSLIALVSAKGSPGVSTAALAFTLTWPGQMLLAECDPAGGDILAGYLANYELPVDRGVLPLVTSVIRGHGEQELPGQLIDLDSPRQQRMLLPGINDPAQAPSLSPGWDRLGEFFSAIGPTVLADCGRLTAPHAPISLMARADFVLLVVNPKSVRTISPAVPAIARLRREVPGTEGAESKLGLLLVGDGVAPRDIMKHLQVPIVAKLTWDASTASALGGDGKGRTRGPLMRSALAAHRGIQTAITARHTALHSMSRRDTDTLPAVMSR
jgi:hypothetical protein